MKTILLMRHAKPAYNGHEDKEYPLTESGKKDVLQIGMMLIEKALIPDLILASTSVRTQQTAEIVKDILNYSNGISSSDLLYDTSGKLGGYMHEIQRISDDVKVVLIVGHNQNLSVLFHELTGKNESFPYATCAHLTTPIDSWKDFNLKIRGESVQIIRPK